MKKIINYVVVLVLIAFSVGIVFAAADKGALSGSMKSLKNTIRAYKKEISDHNKRIKFLQSLIADMSATGLSSEGELGKYQKEIDKINAKKAVIEGKIAVEQGKLDKITGEYNAVVKAEKPGS